MKYPQNIKELSSCDIDFMGFIFYEKSERFISDNIVIEQFSNEETKKVGVFVNNSIAEILNKKEKFSLDYIQLHGEENTAYCEELKKKELKLIKAFSVDDSFDFATTKPFEYFCDYFIFDTKGKEYGGNGVKYDWSILEKYKGNTPFLLSGGITPNDVGKIKTLKHNKLAGIDLNSGFEIEPGLKNIEKIRTFKNKFKTLQDLRE